MSDSLSERFAALAPAGEPDWLDVRRRARRRRLRLPVAAAAVLAALVVAAPAVGLVALLTDSEPPVWITFRIAVMPRDGNLTAAVTGEAWDGRIRTVVLALDGRPQRRQAVARSRTFFFRLSTKDFGHCGALHALDERGRRIAAAFVPGVLAPPLKPPASGAIVVRPVELPRC